MVISRARVLEESWTADQIENYPDGLIGSAVRSVTPTGVGATGPAYRLDTVPFEVDAGRRYVGSIYGQPIATDPDTGDLYVVNWRDDHNPWLVVWDAATEQWGTPLNLRTITGDPFGALIDDSHNTMSVAVCDGIVHVWGNMHTDSLKYARTDATGDLATLAAASFGSDPGNYDSVTYLQGAVVGGQLVASWRNGNSSIGNMFVKRFDAGSLTWANSVYVVNGVPTSEGPYPSKMLVHEDDDGAKMGFFLTWRLDSFADSNSGFTFLESSDLGATWKRVDGTTQPLPMTHPNSVDVYDLDPGSGFINQMGGTYDHLGHPHGAMMLYDADGLTQYYDHYWDGSAWQHEQLTHFTSTVATVGLNTLYLSTSRADMATVDDRVYLIGKTLYDGYDAAPLVIDATPGADHTPQRLAAMNLAGWEPSAIDLVGARAGRLNLFLCSVDQIADSELNWDRQWAGVMSIATDALASFVRKEVQLPTFRLVHETSWSMPVTAVGGTADADVSAKLPRTLLAVGRTYPKGTKMFAQMSARVTSETGTTSGTLYLRASPSGGAQATVDVAKIVVAGSPEGVFETPLEPIPTYVEADDLHRSTILTPRAIADNAAGLRVEAYTVKVYVLDA